MKNKPLEKGSKLFFAMADGKEMSGNLHRRVAGVIVEQSCMLDDLLNDEKGMWQLRNNRLYVVEIKDLIVRLATKEDALEEAQSLKK